MTFSTLEKQIAQIEAKVNAKFNAQPSGGVDLWLAGLLKSPEENEITLNAATFLIQEGVLDDPDPRLRQRLKERFSGDMTTWPDIRLWFYAGYVELDAPNFDDDEGKDAACYLACVYHEVYQEAPSPRAPAAHVRNWCMDRLSEKFIRPLLARACPEVDAYSTATHKAWLQSILDAPEDQEPDLLLTSLREYVQEIQNAR